MPLLEYTASPPIESLFGRRNTQQYYIPTNQSYHKYKRIMDGFIDYTYDMTFSETTYHDKGSFAYRGYMDSYEIKNKIREQIDQKYESTDGKPENIEYTFRSFDTPQPYIPPTKRRMRKSTPFNLHTNIFGNLIELKTTEDNCVPEVLRFLYPKLANRKTDVFKELKQANTEQVMAWCKRYNIRAIAYTIDKTVIAENIPDHDTSAYRTLAYVSYNNHMYPIQHKYLIEKPSKIIKLEQLNQDDLNYRLKQIIRDVPKSITLYNNEVSSFIHENTQYFSNTEYNDCKTLISKFMFSDKVPHFITYSSVMKYIEPLYTNSSVDSFLPIHHTKPAFYYNKKRDPTRNILTIDKNKAYANCLKDLPYLLSTDIRTYECYKTDKYEIPDALYIATPTKPNILMPRQDIYSGEHIKYCQNKFPFTIQEILKCKQSTNHYTSLIEHLFKLTTEQIAKTVIVRAIGSFQIEPKVETTYTTKIVNDDERTQTDVIQIDDETMLEKIPVQTPKNIYNRKPIAIQIKDKMNRMLFEKMEDLKLTDDDIVQINTDSITFYEKPNLNISFTKDFVGWKEGDYKTNVGCIYENVHKPVTFQQLILNNNTLITGPAGNGKSYHIQHMDLTNAIILSSKHSAIRQHREKGFNAHVIQKFSGVTTKQKSTFPTEQHIIVEECGILTRQHWDFLFKCILLNKRLTILGDFNQLLPVDEPFTFNRPTFINMIFNSVLQKNENWRNTFSLDYYHNLQNGEKDFLIQEMQRHSTTLPEQAEIIIAYRHEIVNKYNDYMLKYHNKDEWDDNVPKMCITNELRDKEIYNNFIMKSQEIPPKDRKHYRTAYARTLYNMQGDECKSYYLAKEDIHWFTTPRIAYTLISRIKNK